MNDSKSVFASKIFWANAITAAVAVLTVLIDQDVIKNNPKLVASFVAAVAVLNVVLRLLTTQAVHIVALFLAFVLPLGVCQAACRHVTPMPNYGQRINRVMLCPTYCPPLIVDYQGQDWPAENSSHLLGWRGDVATLRFDHTRGVWHIEGLLRGASDDIHVPVGLRVR